LSCDCCRERRKWGDDSTRAFRDRPRRRRSSLRPDHCPSIAPAR
jgi:hypothetical protein